MSVYYKEMSYAEAYTPTTFAQNWTKGLEVSSFGSAYSTMILQADGNFGFFYEELPGDNYAYCMVYVPLSLEEMTNGAYSLYTVKSTITEAEIGTFYASEAMQIPEGISAFVADKEPEGDLITMKKFTGIIPARTGAVLRGAAGDYKFIPSISYGTPVVGNMLVGHEAENSKDTDENRLSVTVDGSASIYVLANDSEGAKFYKKNSDFTVKNNKAYLEVKSTVQETNRYRISFADEQDNEDEEENGGTTEIESSTLNSQPSTWVYDLQGRRVLTPTKGVYIVNGKKVVIK